MKCRKMVVSWSIFVLFVLFVMTAYAQVPRKINYQGYLTDSVTGMPVNNDVEMTFSIYDVASDGTALWTETQTVTVADGRYSIQLGENTPIDLLEPKPYWLGVQIGTEPELTPREELTSALYALFAKYLEGITIKDGKVGIGTDDPQDMLDVHGNVHIRGTLHVGPNSFIIEGMDELPNTDAHTITTTDPDTDVIHFKISQLETSANFHAGGNITSEGNIAASGAISAGSISTAGLDVNGKIKGNTICLGDSCLDTWPDPCACLPECEDGQVLQYDGSTAKWECGIVMPTPTPTPMPVPKTALYRLYLGVGGSGWTNHLDSLSANEKGSCQGRLGYVLKSQISGTKPLYRIWRSHDASGNDIKDDHMTTDNVNEVDSGGNNEGIMGYVYTTQVSGTIPLYRKYRQYWYTIWGGRNLLHTDHITTTDRNEGNSEGWKYERVLGYIVGPASSSCQ